MADKLLEKVPPQDLDAEAAILGADVATVPFKVLAQLYKHPLTDAGLDRFLADWQKTGRSFDD